MKITRFVFLILSIILFTSCTFLPANGGNPLNGTNWSLESYGGKPLLADTVMTAQFDQGEISGSASCNQYFGSYRIRGDQLTIEGLGWTEMACLNPDGVMEQEQEIMRLLGSASEFQLDGSSLIVQTNSGQELIFRTQSME